MSTNRKKPKSTFVGKRLRPYMKSDGAPLSQGMKERLPEVFLVHARKLARNRRSEAELVAHARSDYRNAF